MCIGDSLYLLESILPLIVNLKSSADMKHTMIL